MSQKYQTEPVADIRASYGPSAKDMLVEYYVRGVRVYPLRVHNEQGYKLVVFPGEGNHPSRTQWVSPANLDEKRRE